MKIRVWSLLMSSFTYLTNDRLLVLALTCTLMTSMGNQSRNSPCWVIWCGHLPFSITLTGFWAENLQKKTKWNQSTWLILSLFPNPSKFKTCPGLLFMLLQYIITLKVANFRAWQISLEHFLLQSTPIARVMKLGIRPTSHQGRHPDKQLILRKRKEKSEKSKGSNELSNKMMTLGVKDSSYRRVWASQ